MYPSSSDGGLLRLHSTYRHDLKIYSSDEGRVQTSAAAFAKGLLDLEGDSLVRVDALHDFVTQKPRSSVIPVPLDASLALSELVLLGIGAYLEYHSHIASCDRSSSQWMVSLDVGY